MHDLAANESGAERDAEHVFGANETATHGVPADAIDAKAVDTNAADANAISASVINANVVEQRGRVPVDTTSRLPASIAEKQRVSLVEPGAALMAMARPFLAARSAWLNLLNYSPQDANVAGGTIDNAAENGVLVERSFANEVASLLRAPHAETVHCDDTIAKNTAAGTIESSEAHGSPVIVANSQHPVSPLIDSQTQVTSEIADAQQPLAHENVDWQKHVAQQNIVVASLRQHRGERVVPLTRLPLRPQGFAITWTANLAEFESTGTPSRTQRHGLLERLVREPSSVSSDVVARAYAEEDGEGRAIALRVLLRNFPQAGRAAFVEALRVGSDEERAIAVDGLTAVGAREELTPAFADRVDAIAAKAALAYVGTFSRADYTAALSPYIDEAQIDTILKLLAGIVE